MVESVIMHEETDISFSGRKKLVKMSLFRSEANC